MTTYSVYDGFFKIVISQQTDGWKFKVLDGSICIGEGQGYTFSSIAESTARLLVKQNQQEDKLVRQLYR